MTTETRKSLEEYLAMQYSFRAIADPDGGYVIIFPDLPGCMTQVESVDEIVPMAEDARRGWIETAYEHGMDIPLPSYPEEYSGKFNVRLPRSLHRQLAEAAEREGVSLNQYVVMLLSRGDVPARLERLLAEIADKIDRRPTALEKRVPAHQDDGAQAVAHPGQRRRSMARRGVGSQTS